MINTNNKVIIQGTIATELVLDHEAYNEKFYKFTMDTKRTSNEVDRLPVIISEKLLFNKNCSVGMKCRIEGQFRSHNAQLDGKTKLILQVFVQCIKPYEGEDDVNSISLSGYVCKAPKYRTTPFGRQICDILLAVNRYNNRSDYIPCITWGRNAVFAEQFAVGTYIVTEGRIQSRQYTKKHNDVQITHTAFEVSIYNIFIGDANE